MSVLLWQRALAGPDPPRAVVRACSRDACRGVRRCWSGGWALQPWHALSRLGTPWLASAAQAGCQNGSVQGTPVFPPLCGKALVTAIIVFASLVRMAVPVLPSFLQCCCQRSSRKGWCSRAFVLVPHQSYQTQRWWMWALWAAVEVHAVGVVLY